MGPFGETMMVQEVGVCATLCFLLFSSGSSSYLSPLLQRGAFMGHGPFGVFTFGGDSSFLKWMFWAFLHFHCKMLTLGSTSLKHEFCSPKGKWKLFDFWYQCDWPINHLQGGSLGGDKAKNVSQYEQDRSSCTEFQLEVKIRHILPFFFLIMIEIILL